MTRTLVRGHTLITQSTGLGVLRSGALLVEDGVIRKVGPLTEVEAAGGFDLVVGDPDRHLVLPGLVNAHHHGPRPSRLALNPAPLEFWLIRSRLRNLPPASEDEVYDHTLWAALRLLRSGVTAVVEHYQPFGPPEKDFGIAASIQAYVDAGIRAAVCISCWDQHPLVYDDTNMFLAKLPHTLALALGGRLPPFDAVAYFARWERLAKQFDGRAGRIRLGFGPHGPQWCSDELLQRVRRTADGYGGAPVQIHLLETRFQAIYGYRHYGKSPVQHLVDLGFFGPSSSSAHCVWASPADVQLLAAAGAMVVHNPSSNLILGSGIAPVAELLDAGVPVGFGQDGADFNDQQDMFTDLRLGLRLQRQPVWGRREVTAMDMLAMATRGGAPALGLSHSIGRLEEGYQADLVLLDRTRLYGSPYVSPSEPPEEIVLRRACADDVDHVLVAGEPRIQEGRVVGIDEPALQRRLTASLKRTYEQLPSIDRLYEQLEPYISDFYARWTSDPPALTLA